MGRKLGRGKKIQKQGRNKRYRGQKNIEIVTTKKSAYSEGNRAAKSRKARTGEKLVRFCKGFIEGFREK